MTELALALGLVLAAEGLVLALAPGALKTPCGCWPGCGWISGG